MMKPFLIVGGGISGLLAARILSRRGVEYTGLEKEDRLGGRLNVGHHRLCASRSREHLLDYFPSEQWELVDEFPQQRRKGEWGPVEEEEKGEEGFYLGSHFYSLPPNAFNLADPAHDDIRENFQLNKTIQQIDPATKKVICQDGQELSYEKIIWCTDLELLTKVWQGDKTPLLKLLKTKKEVRGGVSVQFEMDHILVPFKNTIVFPFRFKENRLRALGTPIKLSDEQQLIHWIIFLAAEILEDHDEVAKCLRTFRRELEKEFPELKKALKSEKIVYLDFISGDVPIETENLAILPDLFYLGPQLREKALEPSLRNLDLVAQNSSILETEIEQMISASR